MRGISMVVADVELLDDVVAVVLPDVVEHP
jgi:hypothetical protein